MKKKGYTIIKNDNLNDFCCPAIDSSHPIRLIFILIQTIDQVFYA